MEGLLSTRPSLSSYKNFSLEIKENEGNLRDNESLLSNIWWQKGSRTVRLWKIYKKIVFIGGFTDIYGVKVVVRHLKSLFILHHYHAGRLQAPCMLGTLPATCYKLTIPQG